MSEDLIKDIQRKEEEIAKKKAFEESIKNEYLRLLESLTTVYYGTEVEVLDGFYRGQRGIARRRHNTALFDVELEDGNIVQAERVDFFVPGDKKVELKKIKTAREKLLKEIS